MDGMQFSVLVIDEDPRSRNYLSALLTRQNYAVQAVSSGKEGYIVALRDRPDVIIFDPGISDMPATELLKRIHADRRTSSMFCIALAASDDATQRIDLLSAGCNEYLLKSQESIDKLLKILAGLASGEQETDQVKRHKRGGLLGVFLSAKGGTGTSSMCANIAYCIGANSPDLDIAVMDLVLPIGSLASIVGYEGEFNILSAVSRPLEVLNGGFLRKALEPMAGWNFRLLGGSPDPETANSLDESCIPTLVSAFRQSFDLTFVDLGRSLSRTNLPIILEADIVVIITGPELTTITLTKTAWKYLESQGLDSKKVYMLINHSTGSEGLSKSDVERILGVDIRAIVPYLDGLVSLANNQHMPLLMKMPNDTGVMMIDQVSREILETARRNRA